MPLVKWRSWRKFCESDKNGESGENLPCRLANIQIRWPKGPLADWRFWQKWQMWQKKLWRVSETFNQILRGASCKVEKLSKMVKIKKLEKISMGLANIQMTKMAKTCHFWGVFAKFVISGHKRQRPKWQCSFLLIVIYSLFVRMPYFFIPSTFSFYS